MIGDYLVFLVTDEYFGISLDIVIKIIENRPVTKISGDLDFVDGVINYEENLLKVINLQKALNKKETKSEYQKMVIIKKDAQYFGLKVDAIERIVSIDLQNIKSVAPKNMQKIGIFEIAGLIEIEKELVSIIKEINL